MHGMEHYAKSDEYLKVDAKFAKYSEKFGKAADDAKLEATVKALEKKGHSVKVFSDEKEAVAFLNSLIPDGSSVSMGASTTLHQIGFIDSLKARDAKINNFKAKSAAAGAAGDMAASSKFLKEGATADVFLSSCSAITQDGNLTVADLTGSRLSGWMAAGKLVVVAGTNKIVKDDAEAEERLVEYQLKLESARVRDVYKAPGSAIVNRVKVDSSNPYGSRITVVLIKKSLGY